jgi:FkbM family methyltransferase
MVAKSRDFQSWEYAKAVGTILKYQEMVNIIEYQMPTGLYFGRMKPMRISETESTLLITTDMNGEMIEMAEPGGIMIDVGANVGRYSIPMSIKSKMVYAFEPDPKNCDDFRRNIAYYKDYGKKNIMLCQMGISNKEGMTQLTQGVQRGLLRVANEWGPKGEKPIDICIQPLDHLFGTHGIIDTGKITGIKIDVEGHEYEVLQGAVNILQRDYPLIALETHRGINCAGIWNLLLKLGYTIYDDNGSEAAIAPESQFLCVKEEECRLSQP